MKNTNLAELDDNTDVADWYDDEICYSLKILSYLLLPKKWRGGISLWRASRSTRSMFDRAVYDQETSYFVVLTNHQSITKDQGNAH